MRGATTRRASDAPIPDALAPGSSLPPPLPSATHVAPKRDHDDYAEVARVWREGAAPLLDPVPGMAERERLRLAMVIPSFRRGSGGHNTLLQIFTRLERWGHVCSVWLSDFTGLRICRSGLPSLRARHPRVLRADARGPFTRTSPNGRAPMS